MAATAGKTMPSKTAKTKKAGEFHLDERLVLAGFFALSMLLAVFTAMTPPGVKGLFTGALGVFGNLILLFYALAVFFALRAVYDITPAPLERWRGYLLAALAALALAAESLSWSLPFPGLAEILRQVLEGAPRRAGMGMTFLIAGARLAFWLGVIYGLGALFYFRKEIGKKAGPLWKKLSGKAFFPMAAAFAGLFIPALLLEAGFLPFRGIFGECAAMNAALAYLLAVLAAVGGDDSPQKKAEKKG